MPIENFFQALAVRLLPEPALDLDLTLKFVFTDLEAEYLLTVKNSVLNYSKAPRLQSLKRP